MGTEHDSLSATLEALTSRVLALEEAQSNAAASANQENSRNAENANNNSGQNRAATPASETFWALNTLAAKRVDHEATHNGTVMIVGSLDLPTGAPVAWQEGAATDAIFEADWSDYAQSFSALGHPARLEILRQIINGTTATAELAELDSLGTTGQLHHHLRQLVSTGWVQQQARGRYEVPPARIVPLLAALMGARR